MPKAEDYGWVRFPDVNPGVRRWIRFDEKGECTVKYETDMDDIRGALDHNAAARNHTPGKTADGLVVRAASIPASVQLKWLVEEGLDIHNAEHGDRLLRKLNDPDWAYLRTGGGRLAMTQSGEIR